MALYLIAFNDEWVPDLTLEELRERGTSGRAVIEEMTAAGVFVFSDGGLDPSTAVCSVDPSSGSPVFTDGPFVETKEHLGGFAVVDVPTMPRRRVFAMARELGQDDDMSWMGDAGTPVGASGDRQVPVVDRRHWDRGRSAGQASLARGSPTRH